MQPTILTHRTMWQTALLKENRHKRGKPKTLPTISLFINPHQQQSMMVLPLVFINGGSILASTNHHSACQAHMRAIWASDPFASPSGMPGYRCVPPHLVDLVNIGLPACQASTLPLGCSSSPTCAPDTLPNLLERQLGIFLHPTTFGISNWG